MLIVPQNRARIPVEKAPIGSASCAHAIVSLEVTQPSRAERPQYPTCAVAEKRAERERTQVRDRSDARACRENPCGFGQGTMRPYGTRTLVTEPPPRLRWLAR